MYISLKMVTHLVVEAIRRLQVISKTKVTFNHNGSLLPDWSYLRKNCLLKHIIRGKI